ncbi:TetR family transcriptional regulator [Camelimonas sp. ID_303_24]
MSRKLTDNGADAAERLRAVALRMFAERGVNAVTVRQIAGAAGQKNHAIVGYYFGSKDDLVRDLIVYGARMIDELRNQAFDDLEAAGGPDRALAVTRALVHSALPPATAPWSDCFNRFLSSVSLSNRALMMEALDGRWNSGYLRAIGHLRRLLAWLPPVVLSQRLIFMEASLGGMLVARERTLADRSRPHPVWNDGATLDHIARSLAAMLEAEP